MRRLASRVCSAAGAGAAAATAATCCSPAAAAFDLSTSGVGRKVYFETYGCQMNVNDVEIGM